MERKQMLGALEAVLFAAGEPITVAELAMVMHLEKPQVWDLLTTLEQSYEGEERGLMLRQTGNAYQLVTKPAFYTMLTALGRKKRSQVDQCCYGNFSYCGF